MSTPTLLGDRYQLGEVIGSGGMADVYLAKDQLLGREVAVKVLRDPEPDPTDRARFMSEARTLAGLNHPHLVTLLDAGTSADRPFLVMELVRGTNLGEATRRGGPVPPQRMAEVGAQVAEALAYVHEAGVVHRDVKPGNVLLREDRRVLLADFGIARLVNDTAHHTRVGTTIGSPAYFSPEQVQGLTVTPASDVYSLGLVLLEALTGERAYGGTPTEAAMARLNRNPEIPSTLPAGWVTLLQAMTDPEPTRRPDAQHVLERLRALAGGDDAAATQLANATQVAGATQMMTSVPPAAARPEPTTSVPRAEEPAQKRKRPYWAIAVGIVLVAAVIVALVLLGDRGATVPDVPDDVPSQLRDPLQDLHDSVEEAGQ
ncbi:serine/threonine-protein kinase [Aeromicrobium sp. IC_218]|uniref:serine/threonine-protein kinase n=1 Tax=Aeromicrobium sp. IC_218 TaxID=2545468 RepID=UPI0013F3B25A|nr:serine/threonine-protein kinase [Aeromicrobium sp. IC_218]